MGKKRTSAVDFDSKKVDSDYESMKDTDKKRLKLLHDIRGIAPGWLVFSRNDIRNTALPRIAANPTSWIALILFVIAAVLRRRDVWVTTHNPAAVQGSSLLMTFIIVFFLGYCYNRHYSQYFAAMKVCGAFIETCSLLSAYVKRGDERQLVIEQVYRSRR